MRRPGRGRRDRARDALTLAPRVRDDAAALQVDGAELAAERPRHAGGPARQDVGRVVHAEVEARSRSRRSEEGDADVVEAETPARRRAEEGAEGQVDAAAIIECPLGKLVEPTIASGGTTAGRGRANTAFNAVFRIAPPMLASSMYASMPKRRSIAR